MKRYVFVVLAACFFNLSSVFSLQNNTPNSIDPELVKGGVKAVLTAASASYCADLGAAWACDLTTKAITSTVKHEDFLFHNLVGGLIRGKALQEALPEASARGALIGAAIGGFLVPFTWDCSVSVYHSYCKTFGDFYSWLNSKEIYTGNKIDYGVSLGTTVIVPMSALTLYNFWARK